MIIIPVFPDKNHNKVCRAIFHCNALRGIRIAHNSLDFFLEDCVRSKTMRVIFYLSSLCPPLSFPSIPCRDVHFPSRVYRNLFLLFLFPNEPPNANGITTHPRSHDSFYIHDEMLAHSKARGLNVRFSLSTGNPCRLFFRKFLRKV